MLPDEHADRIANTPQAQRILPDSRLRYHLRPLDENATEPDRASLERLAMV